MGTGCEVGMMSSNALLDYVVSRLCARDFRKGGGNPELWISALQKRKNILSCSTRTVYVAKSKLQGNLNELWQSLLHFHHIKPRYLARGRDIPRFVGMYSCWMEEIGFLPENIKSRSYSGTSVLLFFRSYCFGPLADADTSRLESVVCRFQYHLQAHISRNVHFRLMQIFHLKAFIVEWLWLAYQICRSSADILCMTPT